MKEEEEEEEEEEEIAGVFQIESKIEIRIVMKLIPRSAQIVEHKIIISFSLNHLPLYFPFFSFHLFYFILFCFQLAVCSALFLLRRKTLHKEMNFC